MFVTKIQIAHRQLSSAIDLYFDDTDVVAVHSLAALASRLFGEIIGISCPDRLWSRHAAEIDHLDTTGYVRIDHGSRRFLDLVGRGDAEWLEFSTRETEDLLFLSVMNAAELGELSVHESTYRLWYCATRAIALGEDFPLVPSAVRIFPQLYAMNRRQRVRCGRLQLDRLLNREIGHERPTPSSPVPVRTAFP